MLPRPSSRRGVQRCLRRVRLATSVLCLLAALLLGALSALGDSDVSAKPRDASGSASARAKSPSKPAKAASKPAKAASKPAKAVTKRSRPSYKQSARPKVYRLRPKKRSAPRRAPVARTWARRSKPSRRATVARATARRTKSSRAPARTANRPGRAAGRAARGASRAKKAKKAKKAGGRRSGSGAGGIQAAGSPGEPGGRPASPGTARPAPGATRRLGPAGTSPLVAVPILGQTSPGALTELGLLLGGDRPGAGPVGFSGGRPGAGPVGFSGGRPGDLFGPSPGSPPLPGDRASASGTGGADALATPGGAGEDGGEDDGGEGGREDDGPQDADGREADRGAAQDGERDGASPVTRTVREFVEVVPDSIKTALAALAALAAMLGAGYLLTALRARRLRHQRGELLEEVGLLQAALLPPVPERFGPLRVSVAYRPADGPGAGGDFYDVVALHGGRTGFLVGDVSGHGRGALGRTAFLRYTLRAYLEAGLEPRAALRLAGQVIEDLDGDFATVLLAIHDPADGSLTYSAAGHPAPVVVGGPRFDPVQAASSPPIGAGMEIGQRQTTMPLEPGAIALLHTDGLTEARTPGGGLLGRGRLSDLLDDLGPEATAPELLDAVAQDAERVDDDMAACLFASTAGVTAGGFRTELLELSAEDLRAGVAERFLAACGFAEAEAARVAAKAHEEIAGVGSAVVKVRFGPRGPRARVRGGDEETLQAAQRRARSSAGV